MTNQGDRAGDIVLLDEALIFVAPGGLYLRWFLYGELVSDGVTEIVMVVECWRSNAMFFARCEHENIVVCQYLSMVQYLNYHNLRWYALQMEEMGNFELRLRQVRACKVFQNFDHEWGVKVEVQSFLGYELQKVRKFG